MRYCTYSAGFTHSGVSRCAWSQCFGWCGYCTYPSHMCSKRLTGWASPVCLVDRGRRGQVLVCPRRRSLLGVESILVVYGDEGSGCGLQPLVSCCRGGTFRDGPSSRGAVLLFLPAVLSVWGVGVPNGLTLAMWALSGVTGFWSSPSAASLLGRCRKAQQSGKASSAGLYWS